MILYIHYFFVHVIGYFYRFIFAISIQFAKGYIVRSRIHKGDFTAQIYILDIKII